MGVKSKILNQSLYFQFCENNLNFLRIAIRNTNPKIIIVNNNCIIGNVWHGGIIFR